MSEPQNIQGLLLVFHPSVGQTCMFSVSYARLPGLPEDREAGQASPPKSELLQGDGAVRRRLFPPQVNLRDNLSHLGFTALRGRRAAPARVAANLGTGKRAAILDPRSVIPGQ
jgi:hypothetical protein